jgi:large subunit ribosomal protein L15
MAKAPLSNLKFAPGSRKRVKRIARGQGSGHGGTSTRGHKGEGARSGTHFRPWFEGGQMPLIRRVPKFGFTNPSRVEFQAVSKKTLPVKVLGDGDLKSKIEITAHAFSESAVKKIEAAGGTASTISSAKK